MATIGNTLHSPPPLSSFPRSVDPISTPIHYTHAIYLHNRDAMTVDPFYLCHLLVHIHTFTLPFLFSSLQSHSFTVCFSSLSHSLCFPLRMLSEKTKDKKTKKRAQHRLAMCALYFILCLFCFVLLFPVNFPLCDSIGAQHLLLFDITFAISHIISNFLLNFPYKSSILFFFSSDRPEPVRPYHLGQKPQD